MGTAKIYEEPYDGYNELFDFDPDAALSLWTLVAKGERERERTRKAARKSTADGLCDRFERCEQMAVRIQKGADSVLVFPFGAYYRDGERREFTREDGEEMVRNFNSDLLERQPPVNLEHERAKGRVGYVRRLWVAGDGVRGEVESVKGNEDVLDRFDYVSPEIRWNWTHPFTNDKHRNVLMGLALTNYPYLLGRMSLHNTWVWTGSEWESLPAAVSSTGLLPGPPIELSSAGPVIWTRMSERGVKVKVQKSATPAASPAKSSPSPAELPPLLSDAYDVTADGPQTEFFAAVDRRVAAGEEYSAALFDEATQRPDSLRLSDLWCAAVATNDDRALPNWLKPKFSLVMARLQDDGRDAAGGVPDPLAEFNAACEQRARELERGGMSRSDALKTAQNELYSEYADVLE